MKEVRVYVINVSKQVFYTYIGLTALSDEDFISIAEKQGGIYSLKGFEKALNYNKINTNTNVIRFIEIETI